MPRYKLTIEYNGAGFAGWQRQVNGLSVQEALETAITRFCGEKTEMSKSALSRSRAPIAARSDQSLTTPNAMRARCHYKL